MTTDIATTGPTPLDAILADPEKLKDLPVETMERLFALQREARSDQAREDFSRAFNAVQAEMTPVKKRGKNTHTGSMYARAEDVAAMLDPIVTKHGFSTSFSARKSDLPNHTTILMRLRHVGGHMEDHQYDAPIDDKGIKGNPTKTALHAGASSMTYVKRQLKCGVFDVNLTDDDDGNAGGGVGPGVEKITQEQADGLNALADDVGADKVAFCRYLKVDAITAIPAGRYREAKQALERKRGT